MRRLDVFHPRALPPNVMIVFATRHGRKLGRRNVLRDVKLLCRRSGFTPPERTLHASVATLKPANGGRGKTGQRKWPGLRCFNLSALVVASPFLFASFAGRI